MADWFISKGKKFQSNRAFGRKDAVVFTVVECTREGVRLSDPENPRNGRFVSYTDLDRFYRML